MVLPSGVNKASGLKAALVELVWVRSMSSVLAMLRMITHSWSTVDMGWQ